MAQRLRNWHQDSVDTDRTALRARMESLIETAPRSAIIKGIRELETTAVDILQKHFYPGYAVNRCSTREIIAYLRYHRILDDAGLEMFEQLDRLRTMAYSLSNPVIDPEAASAMLFAAELLEKDLKGFEIALSVAVPFQPLEQATG